MPTSGPQFVRYFGPVLDALKQLGGSARPSEVRERVVKNLGVSEELQREVTSNGRPRFDNQVAFARFYLAKAGFPPAEAADHREQVLQLLGGLSAPGFERFCQRVLRESGFQQVTVTGKSNDGGIDGIGILQVNALVSFRVLFQCKRYSGTVSPSQVRDFRGAMMGRADKGIILTTGSFTSDAKREALRDGVPPIELVDGEKLVAMLEDLELGLAPIKAFRIDPEFFREFRS